MTKETKSKMNLVLLHPYTPVRIAIVTNENIPRKILNPPDYFKYGLRRWIFERLIEYNGFLTEC